ncbi:acyltransferase family protein [Clostridium beijerinckii]|uniref:Surface polysaccharide O-acyltransferase-like enzyme n=1 Tax=Clostridium beijerinckii TaxID=1520 RepID=A0A9Q5GIH5_CLOBE|nr:acyltransferase family protein [Clostridium beijerinckii]AQS06260.1 glucans biosynthesis protein C [Clostridium beijerinckii]MBA2886298.1 surface polysaccharide O-acyltransferase-like enzyme [Clostridium beijerinckii]MBA2900844.1 surface polysaccharide O-acyltransferase-like enzyme [Clostridium beijerinckii]MBA2910857.1 surface polysaccharide O-acyltransferase-like enzyme [Clostridium beijerinckii]MBA9014130.1 surface polysaccharide O-acyltransferase-like enzyme [Clostridium beijerinckii]
MRKHYIDNIRTFGILLLFPFHTSRIFNSFETFYVVGKPSVICDNFIRISSDWFMPLLFAIAGISASLAMEKHSIKQFIKERFFKLYIPFMFGVILTVPIQTFFAEKQHNGYTGSYFNQYVLFFTKKTDLTGYTGGFTPAHLWFLLFLFVISLVSLPLIILYKKSNKKINENKLNLWIILPLFFFNFLLSIIKIGGQGFGEYLSFFLLGYLILSTNGATKLLENKRLILTTSAIILSIIRMVMIYTVDFENVSFEIKFLCSAFNHLTTWTIILAILGLGKCYFDFSNRILDYFSKSSFTIYIFHQTWLVAIGYYTIRFFSNGLVQFSIIMILTFVTSVLTYEFVRAVPIARFMFGLKK